MFSSFFKVAYRILIRDRVHALVNIFGLALGLAFSIIIFLYVNQETSYDRFHENAEQIYRVGVKGKVSDNLFNHAVTPAPLSGTLIREVPGVENAVRVARFGAWLVRYGNARYNEDNIIFADTSFFSLFSFPLIRGKENEVLREPNSIVLSQSVAKLYFGNEDPIGKMLWIENDTLHYRVTGIMADVPDNSHMHFNMVGSLNTLTKLLHDNWIINYMYTYLLIRPDYSREQLEASLQSFVTQYVLPDYQKFLNVSRETADSSEDTYNFVVQPLTDIHLKSTLDAEFEPQGNILYIYIFTILAIVILVLSCTNFISLATARSAYRAREVIIRKIAGSERNILVRQFLVESSLLAFLSMALALFITELALPAFNRYLMLELRLSQLLNSSGVLLMTGLILIIGIFSGLYPALHFSSFEPVSVLRNQPRRFSAKNHFRSLLVIFQLFICMGVITMMAIVSGQYRYLVNKDLGFNKENILVIRRPDGLKNKLEDFKLQVNQFPGVVAVANSTSIPGSEAPRGPYYMAGTLATHNYIACTYFVSHGFDSTLGITLNQGRFFDKSQPADSSACLINEAFARQLGSTDLLGKVLIRPSGKSDDLTKLKIIGIVNDFNYDVLENPVMPMVMILIPGNYEGYLTIRLQPGDPEPVIDQIGKLWESFTTAYPFVYFHIDQDLRSRYAGVKETARIFSILSLVTLLIACLGLFGLASYSYSRRGFEIGVRKALGADVKEILLYEIRKIVFLLLIASILAWIGIYFLVNSWLSDYAHKTDLNALYFFIPFAVVLLTSLITIFYQAYLAASASPRTALKYE